MGNTPNKGYTLPTIGGDFGVWGIELNGNLTILDANLAGEQFSNVSGNSNFTISQAQAQNLSQVLTGTLTGNITVFLPPIKSFYIVTDGTTGNFSITIATTTPGSFGCQTVKSNSIAVWCDGVNVFPATWVPPGSFLVPPADTTTGSFGSSLSYARADHSHPFAPNPVFGGNVATTGGFFAGGPGVGKSVLSPGDASHPGFVAFFDAANVRKGFLGYSDLANGLILDVEGGNTNLVSNAHIITSGNIETGATLSGTNIVAGSNLSVGATVTANFVTSTSDLHADVNISANGFVVANQITSNGQINAGGNCFAAAFIPNSDRRLKDTYGPAEVGLLDDVPVYTAALKSAPDDQRPMILADELQQAVPGLVLGSPNAVDVDGKPIMQGVDLWGVVQCLLADNQDLRRRVAALEATP